jgi:hypothetical protein
MTARATLVTALLLLPGLLGAAPAAAQNPVPGQPGFRSCGTMAVAVDPWQSSIDGMPREWGTHWIVAWDGPAHPNCAFAKATLRTLIGRKVLAQARNPSRYRNGLCRWSLGSGLESFRPFRQIRCVFPVRSGRTTVHPLIEALVDPDPLLIHEGTAPA